MHYAYFHCVNRGITGLRNSSVTGDSSITQCGSVASGVGGA
jgi:hypothetical protein